METTDKRHQERKEHIYVPYKKAWQGNNYIVIAYDDNGNIIYSRRFRHIDIVNSHSCFYTDDPAETVILKTGLKSINIAAGVITCYFINGFWIEITKKYEK